MSTATTTVSVADMMAKLAALEKENEALKASGAKVVKPRTAVSNGLSLRVGEKGGIAIYGLNNRFPVTLYRQQFEKLAKCIPEIQAFIQANDAKLVYKLEE